MSLNLNSKTAGAPIIVATIAFEVVTPTGAKTINNYAVQTGDDVLLSQNTPPQFFIVDTTGAWTASTLLSEVALSTQIISTESDIANTIYIKQLNNTISLPPAQANVVDLFTWDTTITPTGIKTLDGIPTTTGTKALICAGAEIGEYICNNGGAWTQVRDGADIYIAAIKYFSTNGLGYAGGTVFAISATYFQLEYPTVTIGSTAVNGVSGIDSTADVNNSIPFRSLEYARDVLNSSGGSPERSTINIETGEAGTGIVNETIESVYFNNGTNQTIAGNGGQVYVNNVIFDSSDPFVGQDWTNITFSGINLGVNYAVDAAIEFTQTSTNNISVDANSTISFNAVGVTQIGSAINKSILVRPAFKGRAYLDITGYDIVGDIDLSGNFQADFYNLKQYTRNITIEMRNAAYNDALTAESALTFHNCDFQYFSITINHSGGLLAFKNCTGVQNIVINSSADYIDDFGQILFINTALPLGVINQTGTPANGHAPVFLNNATIKTPINLLGDASLFQQTAASNVGVYTAPVITTGGSASMVDYRDTIRIKNITTLATYAVTTPDGTNGYILDGQFLYILCDNPITALTITAGTGQTINGGASVVLNAQAQIPIVLQYYATSSTSGDFLVVSNTNLIIADGKTLTVNNTLTFTGTDTSSVNFGAGGTVTYNFTSALLENKTLALDSTTFTYASDQSKQMTFSMTAISGTAKVFSFPNYDATLATIAGIETLTNKTLTSPILTTPSLGDATATSIVVSGDVTLSAGKLYFDTNDYLDYNRVGNYYSFNIASTEYLTLSTAGMYSTAPIFGIQGNGDKIISILGYGGGGTGGVPIFSIRNDANANTYINTQNSVPLHLGVDAGNVSGSIASIIKLEATRVGIGTTSINALARLHLETSGVASDYGLYISNFGAGQGWGLTMQPVTAGDMEYVRWNDSLGNIIASIATSSTQTVVLYNTTSDRRAKENIVKASNILDIIDEISIYECNYKGDKQKNTHITLLADQVKDSSKFGHFVTGEKDAVKNNGEPKYLQIDYSKFIPACIGAIKELRTEIKQLKNKGVV